MTVHIYTREPLEDFSPLTMTAHRDAVVGAWWSRCGTRVYSVSRDGACFTWELASKIDGSSDGVLSTESSLAHNSSSDAAFFPYVVGQSRMRLKEKQFFNQQTDHGPAKVRSAQFHAANGLLVVGFSHGVFGLWELPEFNHIHSLR